MIPLTLELENFKGHRYTHIDCTQFNSILIIGRQKNNDNKSNGTGKTTIFDAISYALYKVYPTKTIDKIVRLRQDKCVVTFEFEMAHSRYKIVRSYNRKSSKGDLLLYKFDIDWTNISQKTPTETERELAKIIKIPYNAFRNCVLFSQSDLDGSKSLASEEKSGRRKILKDSLDLSDYTKYEKLAKENLSKVSIEHLNCMTLISTLGNPTEDINNYNVKLTDIKSLLKDKNSLLDSLQISLYQKKFELNDLSRMSSSELSSTQDKLNEIIINKRNLQNSINTLKKSISDKESQKDTSVASLNIEIGSMSSLSLELEKLSLIPVRTDVEIKEDITKHTTNENNGKAHLKMLENEQIKLRRPLPDGDKCPHCRQIMTDDHKIQCARDTEEQLLKLGAEIDLTKSRLNKIKSKRESAELELNNLNSLNAKINNLKNSIENKKIKIQHSQAYVKQVIDIICGSISELSTQEKRLKELVSREASVKESIKLLDVGNIDDKINKVNKEVSDIELSIKQTSDLITRENTNLGMFTQKLESRIQDLEKLTKLNEEFSIVDSKKRIANMVVYGFSSSGIPTMIINTVLDDLQIESNKILSELRPELELQFSIVKDKSDGTQEDDLDITYMLDGENMDYEMLSGGQKLIIALSLKLGMSMVIQHRLGVDLKMLQLDEVERSLDKSGVDSFAYIIKKLQDKFKIFVVTHNDWIKSKFSHAILVEHDGKENGSTASIVTSW